MPYPKRYNSSIFESHDLGIRIFCRPYMYKIICDIYFLYIADAVVHIDISFLPTGQYLYHWPECSQLGFGVRKGG